MPDRDDWTAAMVLEWILSRDLSAVLSMDVYGATAYEGDQTVPVRPCAWQDVQSEHLRKDPPGEHGVREKVLRGLTVVLPAMNSVYAQARMGNFRASPGATAPAISNKSLHINGLDYGSAHSAGTISPYQ